MNEAAPVTVIEKDTVYVERVRVDTVYVDRAVSQEHVTRSLEGFAPNNMVLLPGRIIVDEFAVQNAAVETIASSRC
ncbi:hypothetical protein PEC18_09080 [Paucibacter sp. O1-1]|nr:hypothetical protein [Paucibacter sp. O1-1]MDA3826008.1 hypothetical protein [Paucibacter sp. O1-1]